MEDTSMTNMFLGIAELWMWRLLFLLYLNIILHVHCFHYDSVYDCYF